jgi:carboxyl-terminal processing protease
MQLKTNKYLFLIFSATLFISQSVSATVSITDIKDVKPQDPNVGIYRDVINTGALSLDRMGNFRPNELINKAAFLKAAFTYSGFKPQPSFNFFTGYSDVPEESWFAPYVKKALDIRTLTNRLGDNFFPAENLTRQDALLMVMNIYGIPTPLTQPTADELYKDIRLNHPLASIYGSAHEHAIYFENGQENFMPYKPLTRGDAADLLFKTKMAGGGASSTIVTVAVPDQSGEDLLQNEKFSILVDAWQKIHSEFVYTDKINENQLVYGAISGMITALDDPYSTFRAPNDMGQSFIYIPENYEGIGTVIELIGNDYTVQTTLNNSPAARAGLKTNDVITAISGQTLKDLTIDQVMALIKGKAGTSVTLTVLRNGQTMSFSIVREKIDIESIHKEVLPNNINYLRIDQFTESTATEFDKTLTEVKASGSKKLIIDLRNNPGGYLVSTQELLGHFIAQDQVEFYTEDKSQAQTPYYSSGTADLKDYKVVVLINEGSASAAEITAGALQDYGLAYLIGTTSFGKGSVQEITSYTDNSSLKLTIAKWLTPKKRSINHIGVKPDQEVKITDTQKAAGQDTQLDAAKAYLNR